MQINFSIASNAETLAERFHIEVNDHYTPSYNAKPSNLLPVITSQEPTSLSHFFWGINPSFSKSRGVSDKLLYAPIEHVLTKPSLKKSLQRQRCVILADGFYAWKEIAKKEKVPYRFYLDNNVPFGIAGLWDSFETEPGETVHTFMMVTTPASAEVKKIEQRMPAILSKDLMLEWLNEANTAESLNEFVKPYSEEHLLHHSINPKLADSDFNDKRLWEKVPPANQFGNLTLFN